MSPEQDNKQSDRRYNAPLERAFYYVRHPIQQFIRQKTASGIVLFLSTVLALMAANSPLSEHYQNLINLEIALEVGSWELVETLQLWVSDGLMGIFFLYVGLEIKREILHGELSTPQKRALPVIAALGGMIVPALIYLTMNPKPIASYGWGVPVATDIAFSIGILALLGDRVPRSLYMFLITLAIVDDLGAVAIIAIFYTDNISFYYLAYAGAMTAVLIGFNLMGIRRTLPYVLVGAILWFAMLKSGVHATMAGVILAFAVPARPKIKPQYFGERTRHFSYHIHELSDEYDLAAENNPNETDLEHKRHTVIQLFKKQTYIMETTLHKLQDDLRVPIAFLIMPVFAFVNAGIPVNVEQLVTEFTNTISVGIIWGLIAGKFIGISVSSMLAIKLGIARLPGGEP